MDEMSIQEAIDYIRGKFQGMEAMLAFTIGTLDQGAREVFREQLNGFVATATRINIEADILDKSTPHTEPFYRGVTDAIDGVASYLNRASEEG